MHMIANGAHPLHLFGREGPLFESREVGAKLVFGRGACQAKINVRVKNKRIGFVIRNSFKYNSYAANLTQ